MKTRWNKGRTGIRRDPTIRALAARTIGVLRKCGWDRRGAYEHVVRMYGTREYLPQ